MATLTDIRELKTVLEVDQDNPNEDAKLLFMIEWAGDLIEDYLGRKLERKARTEYYDGTDTPRLQLKARPVLVDGLAVYRQDGGYYGQASGAFGPETLLTYGSDYVLDIDQDDGTSRSGLLVRVNGTWPRTWSRSAGLLASYRTPNPGSVKVTYTAGYTIDTMPSPVRLAANLLVMKLRHLMPLGMELGSESYEERHVSYATRNKEYLLSLIKPILFQYRNWSW